MKFTLAGLLILLILSCKYGNTSESVNQISIEKFSEFDKRFHSDSLFQMSRIIFPIKGKSINGFTRTEWTNKNWEILKSPVLTTKYPDKYKHEIYQSDTLVTDVLFLINSGFKVERKFELKEGKWYLTLYNDINL